MRRNRWMAIVLALVLVTSKAATGTMPVYAQERTETELKRRRLQRKKTAGE